MFYANGYEKDSKITRLAQWEQVKKSTGIVPEKLLEKPKLDENLTYMWNTYVEILGGSNHVGFMEIDCFQKVTGVELSPWQSSLMIQIDLLRRS